MKIALIADPEVAVPPLLYGGIERVLHFLANGLHARGHDVTLFAHRDSHVSCRLVPYPGTRSNRVSDVGRNALAIASSLLHRPVDLIHSFGRLATMAPLAVTAVPKLMSYQRPVTPRSVRMATRLFGSSLEFTACGRHMLEDVSALATWHVVPNGVPTDRYSFMPSVADDAPLVFLGRVEAIKGTDVAIEIARRSGRSLIIAGNVADEHRAFFAAAIEPHLDDRIQYVGPVDDQAKDRLLGRAAALLMPVHWDEPFGIVMAEALACGTPVIGFRRGAVPEIVEHGRTGFVVDSVPAMVDAVAKLDELSRDACRRDAERRFSDRVIVDAYERLYHQRLSQHDAVVAGPRTYRA